MVLVAGLEMLVWAVVARQPGPLVTGSVTSGVGAGVVLAAGPLAGADARVLGGGPVLTVCVGFLVPASSSTWITARAALWAWIPTEAPALLGGGLLIGTPDAVLSGLGWAAPPMLLAGGGWLLRHRTR